MAILTKIASTKRAPVISGGRRGAAVTHLTGIHISPLDPVTAEIALRVATKAPHELLQCFVEGAADVREGDVLVVDGQEYPIRSCADWEWRKSKYLHLVLENIKA
jgi:hypothetical protein